MIKNIVNITDYLEAVEEEVYFPNTIKA